MFIVASHAHTCAAPSGTLKQSSAIGCGREPLRMFRYAFASSLVFLSLHSALNVASEDSALGIGARERGSRRSTSKEAVRLLVGVSTSSGELPDREEVIMQTP